SKSVALTGLNYIIPANTTRTLSIKADIVSSYTGNVVGSITSGTAQGYTSLAAITIGAYAGNTLRAATTPFSATINNAVGAITTVAGASSVKVGSFTLNAGAAEGINVSGVTFTTISTVATQYQNLIVKYGATQIGLTQPTLANSTAYTFSPASPISIALGGQIVVDVYADTIASVTSSAVVVSLTGAQGTGASTNVSRTISGTTNGQTVTVNAAGALTTTLASPAVVSQQVSMGVTSVKLGSFKLTANNNEGIDIVSIAVISTSTRAQDIVNLRLLNGTTQYGQTVSGVAGATTTTTFILTTPLNVPQNSYVTLDVVADINTLTNGASSTDTVTIALGTVNYQGASSKASASVSTAVNSGASFTIYRTSLNVAAFLPATYTDNSIADTKLVAKFDFTAGTKDDANVSSITFQQVGAAVSTSSAVTFTFFDANNTPITTTGTITATSTAVTATFSTPITVSKTEKSTILLKANLLSANYAYNTPAKGYGVNLTNFAWGDGTTTGISPSPLIVFPISGPSMSF
ncbi:hypothetical protein KJ636_04770, partial [Patescibacteria group bacterium]|nr:hypothetical protein [Patescibacteria group bacterium]